MSFSYINLSRRFQYALQAFSQTQFFYGYARRLLRASIRLHRSRSGARDADGARRHAFGIYPLNRYARLEMSRRLPAVQARNTTSRACRSSPTSTSRSTYGRTLFVDGTFMPLGMNLVAGDDGLPRVRSARRHTMRSATSTRPRWGEPAVASDRRRRRALLHAPRHQRRAGAARPRLQELGRVPGYSTSAATRRCAATTTCSSSATRRSSPTPSCASR